jgi:D-alanine-D-alanine ligase
MNKVKAKDVMRAAGIPVPEGRVVGRAEVAAGHVLPLPYVLKPIAEGSSFGVVIVRDENAPHELSQQDWTFGEEILAERYTAGLELTCAVLGDRALDIIEIRPTGGRQDGGQGGDDASAGGFYDYHAKYAQGGSVHILPAQIDADVYARIRQWSLDTHRAIGCRGITRTDFRYDPQTGEVVALEINTQPGMTATSLAPEMAAHAGLTFGDLVEWLVKDASLER